MRQPSDQVGWIVGALLTSAALIANMAMPRIMSEPAGDEGVFILFMALLITCGILVLRYE